MLVFRIGKIIFFIPKVEFSIQRPSFHKGIELHIVIWSRGISFMVTTKKIYLENKMKMEKAMKEHQERMKRDEANQKT